MEHQHYYSKFYTKERVEGEIEGYKVECSCGDRAYIVAKSISEFEELLEAINRKSLN